MCEKSGTLAKPGKFGVRAGFLIALISAMATLGCYNEMAPNGQVFRKPADGKAKAQITVSGGDFAQAGAAQTARTIMPKLDPSFFDGYLVKFVGLGESAGKEYSQTMTGTINGLTVELAFSVEMGEWDVTVNALMGSHEVASGSVRINAVADQTVNAEINLKPNFIDGTGTFSWSIDSDKTILGGQFRINKKDGNVELLVEDISIPGGSNHVAGVRDLEVGLYDAHLSLETVEGYTSSISQVVWVFRGATSEMVYDAQLVRHALIRILQQSWDGRKWKFIEPDKIMTLMGIFENSGDIGGFAAANYADIKDFEDALSPISSDANSPMGAYTIDRFGKLLDAALILRAQKDGRIPALDKIYRDRTILEDLVTEIVGNGGNGSDLVFDWNRWNHFNGKLPVIVGGIYEIELDINWAYIAVTKTSGFSQVGRSGEVWFDLSSGHIEDEDGEFAVVENGPAGQTKTVNIAGLPDGVILAPESYFRNSAFGSGNPAGGGKIYLHIEDFVPAGKYPVSVSLSTDALVGDTAFLYVQDLKISPDYAEFQMYDEHTHLVFEVTGEFMPTPGSYEIKFPRSGQQLGQLNWGLAVNTTPFVVDADGNGSGTITITGAGEMDGYHHSAPNPLKVIVRDLDYTITMQRTGMPKGMVFTELTGGVIYGPAGGEITVPVFAKQFQVNNYDYHWHDARNYSGMWWGEVDPWSEIPEGSGITRNDEKSWWVTTNFGAVNTGGELVLNLGDKKGTFEISVSFGSRAYGIGSNRARDSFWVIVE